MIFRNNGKALTDWQVRLAYAAGDGGFNLFWVLFESFAIYFYVQSFGLPVWTITPILLSARGVDLLSALVSGIWADRTRSRYGSYRPFLLWSAVPLGLASTCVFTGPAAWPAFLRSHQSPAAKVAWAAASCIVFAVLYSAANIAYTALLSVITVKETERVRAASARFTAAAIAVFGVQSLTLPLVGRFGRADSALGWQLVAMVYSGLGCLLLLACFAGTREIVAPLQSDRTDFQSLRTLFADRLFLRLLFAMICSLAAFTCRGTITPFYATYNAAHAGWTSVILASNSLAALSVCITVSLLRRRWLSLRTMASTCAAGGAIICFIPVPGQEPKLTVLIAIQIAFGAATGMLLPSLFSLFAELPGRLRGIGAGRTAGLIASASLIALKIGSTLGGVLISSLLGHLGFHAAPTQPPGVLSDIHSLFTYLPGGLFLLTCLLLPKSSATHIAGDPASSKLEESA